MSRTSYKKKSFFRSPLNLAVLLIALIIIAGGWYAYSNRGQTKAGKTTGGNYVNLSPPTKTEKRETEDHKKQLEQEENNSTNLPTTSNGRHQVTPTITSIDKSSVRGFIQGVVEDGGTCTITLTSGTKKVVKTSVGVENVSYTNCTAIDFEGSVSPGAWQAVLSYSSPTSEGKSSATLYTIQ